MNWMVVRSWIWHVERFCTHPPVDIMRLQLGQLCHLKIMILGICYVIHISHQFPQNSLVSFLLSWFIEAVHVA